MIHVGAMNWSDNINTVAATQHQSHAKAPAHSKKPRITASRIPPITVPRTSPLRRSVTKVAMVVRLNPNRASMVNVEYSLKGRLSAEDNRIKVPM